MKDNIDFFQIKTLIKKQWKERVVYPFKNRTFDFFGLILKLVLLGAFIACFVVFFQKFAEIYVDFQCRVKDKSRIFWLRGHGNFQCNAD